MSRQRTALERNTPVTLESNLTAIELAGAPGKALEFQAPDLPADQHPAAVYLARISVGSRRTMRGALDTVAGLLTSNSADARSMDWSALRYQHTTAVRSILAELYAPATANKMLAALRGVLREAWRLGQMSVEDYQRAADLSPVRGSQAERGRALAGTELQLLFAACARDKTAAGCRDAALIAT